MLRGGSHDVQLPQISLGWCWMVLEAYIATWKVNHHSQYLNLEDTNALQLVEFGLSPMPELWVDMDNHLHLFGEVQLVFLWMFQYLTLVSAMIQSFTSLTPKWNKWLSWYLNLFFPCQHNNRQVYTSNYFCKELECSLPYDSAHKNEGTLCHETTEFFAHKERVILSITLSLGNYH